MPKLPLPTLVIVKEQHAILSAVLVSLSWILVSVGGMTFFTSQTQLWTGIMIIVPTLLVGFLVAYSRRFAKLILFAIPIAAVLPYLALPFFAPGQPEYGLVFNLWVIFITIAILPIAWVRLGTKGFGFKLIPKVFLAGFVLISLVISVLVLLDLLEGIILASSLSKE